RNRAVETDVLRRGKVP
ncbi:Nipped-B-like protein, partial [Araneus ventricosus]